MGQTQSDVPGPRSSGELTQQQKDELSQARSRVATEIWESEKVYVKRLEALIKLYKKPLVRSLDDRHPLLPAEAIDAIFSNVEDILGLQEKILYELEGRLNKWTPKSVIGDIFIANADGLKLYVTYINNYDTALNTIRTYSKQNPKFKEFLKESQLREAAAAQNINSLLITVVQRPPRYCLLLKEILKHTPDSHKDRRPLTDALAAVEKAADYINTQKMIAEGYASNLKIRSAFQDKFSFVSTTGPQTLYDGEIKAQARKNKLRVVIFSNYFLVGEEKTTLLGRKKAKFEPIIWCPLEGVILTAINETTLSAAFTDPTATPVTPDSVSARSASVSSQNSSQPAVSSSTPTSPAPKSPSHSRTSSTSAPSSPSAYASTNSPHLILSVPNLVFIWDNKETLTAWMTIVADATTALTAAKAPPSKGFFASLFGW